MGNKRKRIGIIKEDKKLEQLLIYEAKKNKYDRSQGTLSILCGIYKISIIIIGIYVLVGLIIVTFFRDILFINFDIWKVVSIYAAGIFTTYIKDILEKEKNI